LHCAVKLGWQKANGLLIDVIDGRSTVASFSLQNKFEKMFLNASVGPRTVN
jgi:uncharacterized protein (DUF779 family)